MIRVSIRYKLLLVILTLLLIPWMGYQYVREMKAFALQGQEEALLLTASAISTVLHDRPELFSGESSGADIESEMFAKRRDPYFPTHTSRATWITSSSIAMAPNAKKRTLDEASR